MRNNFKISWWSCGVSHPGPKGNQLFIYKFSLIKIFKTVESIKQAK